MSIHKLVKSGSPAEIKKGLTSSNINLKDRDGQTPLHVASYEGRVNVVKLLLSKKGIDVNATDLNGWTPLHCACSRPNFAVCEILLQTKHIDVTKVNNDSTTAFSYLVRQPSEKVSKDLDSYRRCLKLMKITKVMANAVNIHGEPLLHAACSRGNIYSVHFLLQHGAEVNQTNSKQETALHWAVKSAKIEFVKALMSFGADPFLPSSEGITPMEMALKNNDKDIISMLTKRALLCSEVKKECTKFGWIEVCILKEWIRFFFVLQEVSLFAYTSDDGNCKPYFSFDILEVDVGEKEKETKDRPFCFILREEHRTTLLSVKTELDKTDWMKCIDQGKRIYLNTLNTYSADEQGGGVSTPESHSEESIPRLLKLLDIPENLICADCSSLNPYWVSLKFGITVCHDCAIIHRKLKLTQEGLKSIHFDSLSLQDFMILKCNGNERSNGKYESNISNNLWKPTPRSSLSEKESFIHLKYIDKSFMSNVDVATHKVELRKVFASRISAYEYHYQRELLAENLAVLPSHWNHLKETSVIYQKIASVIENEKNEALFFELVKDKLGSSVIGISFDLLKSFLPLIRSIKLASGDNINEFKVHFKNFLKKYTELQETFYDEHIEKILKWILPQILEVLTLLHVNQNLSFNLNSLIDSFVVNSIDAFYAFIGEYLVDSSFLLKVKRESASNANHHLNSIKSKCKSHTDNLRKLISSAHKYSFTSQENTSDSYSDMFVHKKLKVDFDIDLKRTSSATSHSSTETSPRDVHDDVTTSFHPLLHLLDDFFHPLLKSSLSQLIIDFIPQQIQTSVLGVIDSTMPLIDSAVAKNLFNITQSHHNNHFQSRIHLPLSASTSLSTSRRYIEKLRFDWPYLTNQSLDPHFVEHIKSILLRYILIINREINYTFSKGVYWFIPEVWDSWDAIKEILQDSMIHVGIAAQQGFERSSVIELLGLLITQIRWTHSKLLEVQDIEDRPAL